MSWLPQEQSLFLALIKPYRTVTSSTIARWLIEAAGTDISLFSAHTVPGASLSAAANMGITTNDILRAADWSSQSDFLKLYKPVEDLSFGRVMVSNQRLN